MEKRFVVHQFSSGIQCRPYCVEKSNFKISQTNFGERLETSIYVFLKCLQNQTNPRAPESVSDAGQFHFGLFYFQTLLTVSPRPP